MSCHPFCFVDVPVRFTIIKPSDAIVGTTVSVLIEALDHYDNIASSATSRVTLVLNGTNMFDSAAMVSGSIVVPVYATIYGLVSLSLHDSFSTGLVITATSQFVYLPGPSTQFAIPFATSGTVDHPISVTVFALDTYGNLAFGEQRSVTVFSTGNVTVASSGLVQLTNGVGFTTVTSTLPGTYTLRLSDSQSTGLFVYATNTITFASGVSTRFVILPPTTTSVDFSTTVTVEARDQFNNRATAENRSVTLDASGSVTGVGVVTFVNGVATKVLRDSLVETATLSMIDSSFLGVDVSSTQPIVWTPGLSLLSTFGSPLSAFSFASRFSLTPCLIWCSELRSVPSTDVSCVYSCCFVPFFLLPLSPLDRCSAFLRDFASGNANCGSLGDDLD